MSTPTPEERAAKLVDPLRPIQFIHGWHFDWLCGAIAAAIREAVAAEWEACAQIADRDGYYPGADPMPGWDTGTARSIAAAIRARGTP